MTTKAVESITTYQRLVENLAKEAEEFLGQVPQESGQRPSPRLIQKLEKNKKKLEDQYKRMHEAYALAIVDTDLKPEEEAQIEKIIKASETRRDKVMGELKKVLDGDQAANQGPSVPTAPVPSGGSPKTEDTLKLKEPLNKEMNLEEAN